MRHHVSTAAQMENPARQHVFASINKPTKKKVEGRKKEEETAGRVS